MNGEDIVCPLSLPLDIWILICCRLTYQQQLVLTEVSNSFLIMMDRLFDKKFPLEQRYLQSLRRPKGIPQRQMSSWKKIQQTPFYDNKIRLKIVAHWLYHKPLTKEQVEHFDKMGFLSEKLKKIKLVQAQSNQSSTIVPLQEYQFSKLDRRN